MDFEIAERDGRSMEREVRHILRNALKEQNRRVPKLGSRIAARFGRAGLAAELPELHGPADRAGAYSGSDPGSEPDFFAAGGV